MGGVQAIKRITGIPVGERIPKQSEYLDACLTALAHQPRRWYSLQDWGKDGPIQFLKDRGIEFAPVPDRSPRSQSWYEGCGCDYKHWSERTA